MPDGQVSIIASKWPITRSDELDQHVTAQVDAANATLVAEVQAPQPFGTLLVPAAMVAFLWGDSWIRAYIGLF